MITVEKKWKYLPCSILGKENLNIMYYTILTATEQLLSTQQSDSIVKCIDVIQILCEFLSNFQPVGCTQKALLSHLGVLYTAVRYFTRTSTL